MRYYSQQKYHNHFFSQVSLSFVLVITMTRRKVKFAFIVNDAARKATYKKRKKGLLKKVAELSTLCGIEACAIVYGPYEPQLEICPSPEGIQSVLSKFMALHKFQKCKKMMNQETFMTQSVLKAEEKLKKQRKENREQEMTILISQCLNEDRVVHDNMSTFDLSYLTWLIDHNLKDLGRRLEACDNNDQRQSQSQNQNQIMAIQNQVQLQMAATIQSPPLAASRSEEMAIMGHGVGIPINNDDIIQSQLLMNSMVTGNAQETVPFGEVNAGLWPDSHLGWERERVSYHEKGFFNH